MEKVQLPADGSVESSIASFKAGKHEDEEYLVIGYSNKNTLQVVGQGKGFLKEATALIDNSDAKYILLRKTHQVELATTTKFVFVDWTPSALPPTRKALLSTHKTQIKDIVGSVHVKLETSDKDDLDEQEILNKIGMFSGTANHVTDKTAWTHESKKSVEPAAPVKKKDLVPESILATRPLNLEDEEGLRAAIADVRKDSVDTDWVLVHYSNPNTLALKDKGNGGIPELISKLDDKEVYYMYFKTTEVFDKSTTVKFCFAQLSSAKVPTLFKAKLGTHRGFVTSLFDPFHVEFQFDKPEEFTPEYVASKIGQYTGTASRVRDAEYKSASASSSKPSSSSASKFPGGSGAPLTFVDEDALKNAIKAVKSDADPQDWMVCRWSGKNELSLVGSGSGGLSELVSSVSNDDICFGLLRVTNQVDKSVTTKFAFIKLQSDNVPPMKRAAVNVKIGDIEALFQPYHVSYVTTSKEELKLDAIMDLVQRASGTKNLVRDKA